MKRTSNQPKTFGRRSNEETIRIKYLAARNAGDSNAAAAYLRQLNAMVR